MIFQTKNNTLIVPACGLVLFAMSLFSCSNPRYINTPAVHNAAFFKQQGDFKLSVAGSGDITSIIEEDDNQKGGWGFDGQAAVAVTNHFMISVGGMHRTERDKYRDDDLFDNNSRDIKVDYTRTMFDVGIGFYTPMSQSNKVFFNGIFGVGFGKMKSKDNAIPFDGLRSRYFDANIRKYNIHPSFNFFFSDYFRMSVAPRFSFLRLDNVETSYSQAEQDILGYSDVRDQTFGVFEPAILLQAGFRNNDWLKLDFGFNFATDPFTTKSGEYSNRTYAETYNVQSRNFLVSLGLSFYPMGSRSR